MRRLFLMLLLLLALAAPAHGARVWHGPAPFGPSLLSPTVVVNREVAAGADDTRVSAWTTYGTARLGGISGPLAVFAAAGDHDAVQLGRSFSQAPLVAAARGHSIVAWTDWDTRRAYVALPAADGTITPVALAGSFPSAVAINDAGEAAVITQGGLFVRPPGGDFGPPVTIPGGSSLTIAPSGEILFSGFADGVEQVYSRTGDTQSTPFTVPGAQSVSLGADAGGHVLAAWIDQATGVVSTAIRAPDGTWGTPVSAGVTADSIRLPVVAVNGRGDAVVAWQTATGPAYVLTGNLADGALSAPVTIPAAGGLGVSVAIGADGSAALVEAGQDVPLARRDGLGAFGPFETIDCYGGFTNRALTIDDAGHTLVADDGGVLYDTPSDTAMPRACDPITFTPEASYSRKHVIAGEPVRIDAANVREHDNDVLAATFTFADGGATRPVGATAVFHTFPKPGQQQWRATTKQRRRYGDDATTATARYDQTVDVYARATLTAPGFERRPDVRAHGLLVQANAEASRIASPVTVTVLGGGRVLQRLRALLDARPRALRLRLAHVPARVTVQLAQGGRVRATQRIRVR